ncbi:hypothetical protein BGW38_001922 [Lunasporangiospora selenospora]|uniref:Sugar phosphate permease n=1 Tax=Lunasporangiospora selenospora TaxID=979761 RepID=A0A9P6FUX7_9FUNG|nr:hypothetical protein BGW38_001922 [Lunasporangiospora selenospora]
MTRATAPSSGAEETPRTSREIVPAQTFEGNKTLKSSAPSILEVSQSPTLVDISDRAPDGGFRAWMVVLGSFLIHSFCFAPTEYIFGIFEHHYMIMYPSASHGSIAFIGALGSSTTYFAGFVSGVTADKFGYRFTALLGTAVMGISLVLASFATQVWQLYLTQGVLFGIGASLVYYPAIGAPSYWFDAKRGLALGLAVSGTGLGGLGLAPATQALMDAVGANWTLRALALFCVVVCGAASFMITERHSGEKVPEPAPPISDVELGQLSEKLSPKTSEQKKLKGIAGFFAELKVFKDLEFLSLTFAELAASIGFLIPMYYFQTYSLFIGLTAEKGALIAGISSGASCLGRIALGYAADRLPKTLVVSTFGAHQLSTVIGFMYAAGGIGMLSGAPIAGVLLDSTKPNISYLPVIMTAGCTLLLGALCISVWVFFRRIAKSKKRAVAAAEAAAAAEARVGANDARR